MKHTEYLGLNLPDGQERYDVKDFNTNFTILDEKIAELSSIEAGGDMKTMCSVGGYKRETLVINSSVSAE